MSWKFDILMRAVAHVEAEGGRTSPESDHGYASRLPTPQPFRATMSRAPLIHQPAMPRGGCQRRKTRRCVRRQQTGMNVRASSSSAASHNRSLHNEMEKNRRAFMKLCLNKLKEAVPVGPSGRHTTQGLLTAAVRQIKYLEEAVLPKQKELDALQKEQMSLRVRLEALTSKKFMVPLRPRGISPTSSESASSSSSSSSSSFFSQSPSPSSCSETIDVIGTSSASSDASSDCEEHSTSWYSGMSVVGTRRRLAAAASSTSRLVLVD